MADIQIPETVRVWKIGGGSANIRSINNYVNNEGYSLFCQTNGKFLTWKKIPLGINLDFIDDPSVQKTHFKLPNDEEREILSGESVAFGIGMGEAFLHYSHRNLGVNLSWSNDPVFEWRIFGLNNQIGTPITENSLVAIINDKVEPEPDFFVYFDRMSGMADVGWTTSPGFWDSVGDLVNNKELVTGAIAVIKLLIA